MKMHYLDLRCLRDRVLSKGTPGTISSEVNSSRGVIRSIGKSGVRHSFEKIPQENFELLQQEDAICFAVDGVVKWEINTNYFTGDPHVSARVQGDYIDIYLRNAFYPGTCIPADLHCRVYKGVYHWEMDLKLLCATSITSIPFMQWLAGNRSIKTLIDVSHVTLIQLNSRKELQLNGIAKVEMNNQWDLKLKGKQLVHLTGFGELIEADKLVIRLNTATSVSSTPLLKSSTVSIYRQDHLWKVLSDLQFSEGQQLVDTTTTFDMITIESGVDCEENCVQMLVAESERTSDLSLLNAPDRAAQQEETHFGRVCYAVEFEDEDEKFALVAANSQHPVEIEAYEMLTHPIDLEMRNEVNLELMGINNQVEILHCAPPLPRMTMLRESYFPVISTVNL